VNGDGKASGSRIATARVLALQDVAGGLGMTPDDRPHPRASMPTVTMIHLVTDDHCQKAHLSRAASVVM
jgi:hypothetical protein